MVRTCHQDNCPVGIATQRPDLRAKFTGTPDMVVHYLEYVATETRELLASLGLRSLDEAVGRVDLLAQRRTGDHRADSLDLSPLLATGASTTATPGDPVRGLRPDPASPLGAGRPDPRRRLAGAARRRPRPPPVPDRQHRPVGRGPAGVAVGKAFGSRPPAGRARIELEGTAGQSFGAFLAPGIDLRLVGACNDYVGKGMGGGRIVVLHPLTTRRPGPDRQHGPVRGDPGRAVLRRAGRGAVRRAQLGRHRGGRGRRRPRRRVHDRRVGDRARPGRPQPGGRHERRRAVPLRPRRRRARPAQRRAGAAPPPGRDRAGVPARADRRPPRAHRLGGRGRDPRHLGALLRRLLADRAPAEVAAIEHAHEGTG